MGAFVRLEVLHLESDHAPEFGHGRVGCVTMAAAHAGTATVRRVAMLPLA